MQLFDGISHFGKTHFSLEQPTFFEDRLFVCKRVGLLDVSSEKRIEKIIVIGTILTVL